VTVQLGLSGQNTFTDFISFIYWLALFKHVIRLQLVDLNLMIEHATQVLRNLVTAFSLGWLELGQIMQLLLLVMPLHLTMILEVVTLVVD